MNTYCPRCGDDSENGEDCQPCQDAASFVAMAQRGDTLTRLEAEALVRSWLWWQVYNSDPRPAAKRPPVVQMTLRQMKEDTGLSLSRCRDILLHMAESGAVSYTAKQGQGFTVVVKEG